MIYLITAPPGTGKTNFALQLLAKLKKEKPDRLAYVSNVRSPRHDLIGSIPLDHVKEWESLPDGSIVLIDELQDQIPQRNKGVSVPEWLNAIAKHRHRGFDFIFTTQHASLVDVFIRRQTGEMVYLRRKARALAFMSGFRPGGVAITWDRYEEKPDEFLKQRNAVKRGYTLDKKTFDQYESTTLDTHKPKVPWQILALILGVVICGTMLYRGISRFMPKDDVGKGAATAIEAQAKSALALAAPAGAAIAGDRMASFWPRVKGIPVSAPAYDGLSPSTIPKVYCMASGAGRMADGTKSGESCTCFTEQGTPVLGGVDVNFCLATARHGIYDPYRVEQNARQGDERAQAPQPVASAEATMTASGGDSQPYGTMPGYGDMGVR